METDRCYPAEWTDAELVEGLVHVRRMSQAIVLKLRNIKT